MIDKLCEEFYNLTLTPEYLNYSVKHFPYPGDPTFWKKLDYVDCIKIMAYVIIIIGGLLGNISVILTVALNRSMRTTINLYVANLAVADAMICIICMLPTALTVMTENAYILGEFMCKFNPFTQMTCLTSSVLTLSAISCDRFMAIMFPLHVRITKQRTSVVMTIVWIVSIVVSIPFLIVKKHIVIEWQNVMEPKCTEEWPVEFYYEDSITQCVTYEPLRVLYYVVVSITLFFLPIFIMITAYSLILWRLGKAEVPGEQHAANVNIHSRARKKNSSGHMNNLCGIEELLRGIQMDLEELRQNGWTTKDMVGREFGIDAVRTTYVASMAIGTYLLVNKMVFVVLVAFIICWTPLQAIVLYSAFGHNAALHGALPDWFPDLKWFSFYIAYANSFVNPIIYGGFNKTFREGFCIVLRCGFKTDRYGRSGRSRMTFTTGVTSSPSRNASKIINGATKPQKTNMEMKLIYPATEGDLSPTVRETCVSIADAKEHEYFT